MKKRYPDKTNILLVNITRLGDMLQATPTIAGMKAENPDSRVTVLVEKQFEEVCHSIPNVDEVVSVDLGMTVRSLSREQDGIIDAYEYVSEVVTDLRGRQFDYCLNMSSSGYTALLLKLVGIERNGGWTADDEGHRVIESDWARLFATSVFHQNRQYNSLNLVDVFRCSADVDKHPNRLLLTIPDDAEAHAEQLIREAGFTNTGPLIAIQAGASQEKRQWAPAHFIKLVNILVQQHNARVVLVGTKKELAIIDPIKAGCDSPNVAVFAGKTTIPQLAAVLEQSDILVTGDTGPMHVCVATGTPVVAMFLASAYGYETGPYSEGNIVLQPVIGCGPCNPNKPCSQTDCHDTISPELVAKLTMMRLQEDFRTLPEGFVDPRQVIVYRSEFDRYGFCDLRPLSSNAMDPLARYRDAYRKVWLEDIGGFELDATREHRERGSLTVLPDSIEGLRQVVELGSRGEVLIEELKKLIRDVRSSGRALVGVNEQLSALDRRIEEIGFNFGPLGPLTRMFIFAKENLSGSDPMALASNMGTIYGDLIRRGNKLAAYYGN
jgi:ADP-heptose:LPS heptosyltransferase